MILKKKSSEEKLTKTVIKGGSQAYGELYKRYLDEIYRYVYYRVAGNLLEAENLIQIVFRRARGVMLRNNPKNYNFRTLVYRITHNLTVDRWRTQKQEYSLEAERFETLENATPHPINRQTPTRRPDGTSGYHHTRRLPGQTGWSKPDCLSHG